MSTTTSDATPIGWHFAVENIGREHLSAEVECRSITRSGRPTRLRNTRLGHPRHGLLYTAAPASWALHAEVRVRLVARPSMHEGFPGSARDGEASKDAEERFLEHCNLDGGPPE